MKKNTAADFYLRISIWTLICLVLAAGSSQVAAVIAQVLISDGNETSAAQSIQTIKVLQAQYSSKHQGRFAPNFEELIKEVYLDEKFAETSVVNGYVFTMKVEEPTKTKPAFYSINADPLVSESITATGTRHFYYDSTLGVTKSTEENRQAKADDPGM